MGVRFINMRDRGRRSAALARSIYITRKIHDFFMFSTLVSIWSSFEQLQMLTRAAGATLMEKSDTTGPRNAPLRPRAVRRAAAPPEARRAAAPPEAPPEAPPGGREMLT